MSEMLTPQEVAAWIKVPVGTLYWWRHEGDRGPRSFTLGRHVRYWRADVESWISARSTGYAVAGEAA